MQIVTGKADKKNCNTLHRKAGRFDDVHERNENGRALPSELFRPFTLNNAPAMSFPGQSAIIPLSEFRQSLGFANGMFQIHHFLQFLQFAGLNQAPQSNCKKSLLIKLSNGKSTIKSINVHYKIDKNGGAKGKFIYE